MAKKKRKTKQQKPPLEDRYLQFFTETNRPNETESLKQPTIFKDVSTVVTYGAYEDPI